MIIKDILSHFTQIPSSGLHLTCSHCNCIFSDMNTFPDWVIIAMLTTHLKECEAGKDKS